MSQTSIVSIHLRVPCDFLMSNIHSYQNSQIETIGVLLIVSCKRSRQINTVTGLDRRVQFTLALDCSTGIGGSPEFTISVPLVSSSSSSFSSLSSSTSSLSSSFLYQNWASRTGSFSTRDRRG